MYSFEVGDRVQYSDRSESRGELLSISPSGDCVVRWDFPDGGWVGGSHTDWLVPEHRDNPARRKRRIPSSAIKRCSECGEASDHLVDGLCQGCFRAIHSKVFPDSCDRCGGFGGKAPGYGGECPACGDCASRRNPMCMECLATSGEFHEDWCSGALKSHHRVQRNPRPWPGSDCPECESGLIECPSCLEDLWCKLCEYCYCCEEDVEPKLRPCPGCRKESNNLKDHRTTSDGYLCQGAPWESIPDEFSRYSRNPDLEIKKCPRCHHPDHSYNSTCNYPMMVKGELVDCNCSYSTLPDLDALKAGGRYPKPRKNPRAVPCECGSSEPFWRDCGSGLRLYLCDECFEEHQRLCNASHDAREIFGDGEITRRNPDDQIELESGDFGWDYLIRNLRTGETLLIQTDWDYPGLATTFGWSKSGEDMADTVSCFHTSTDGTVDCRECGKAASEFIAEAAEYLDDHIGDVVEDPGYFE